MEMNDEKAIERLAEISLRRFQPYLDRTDKEAFSYALTAIQTLALIGKAWQQRAFHPLRDFDAALEALICDGDDTALERIAGEEKDAGDE